MTQAQEGNQSIRISGNYQGQSLESILLEWQNQHQIHFTFRSEDVRLFQVDHRFNETDLPSALSELLAGKGLAYKEVMQGQILINPLPGLRGMVKDEESHRGLAYSNVRIRDSQLGTVALEQGFFFLPGEELDDQATVLITQLGYEPLSIKVADLRTRSPRDLWMKAKKIGVAPVVISDYLTQGVGYAREAIDLTPKEVPTLPGLVEPDIFGLVGLLPGVSNPYETTVGLHVRGGTPDQTLVRYNGIPMYQTGHFFDMISGVNPYAVESAQLYRGAYPSSQPGRASGVLEISQGDEIPLQPEWGTSLNLTSIAGNASLPLKDGKGAVFLSARRALTDILPSLPYRRLYDRVFQNTRIEWQRDQEEEDPANVLLTDDLYRFSDFSLKFLLRPHPQHTWTISAMRNAGLFRIGVEEINTSLGLHDEFRSTSTGLGVDWKFIHSDNYQLRTSLIYADARTLYTYQFQVLDTEFNLESLSTENEVRDWTLEHEHRWSFHPKHQLSWGLHVSHRKVPYELDARYFGEQAIDESSPTALTPSLFVEHLWRPHPKWEFQSGLRYSRHSLWGNGFIDPRLTILRQMGEQISLRASMGVFRQYLVQLLNFGFDELNVGTPIWALVDEEDNVPVLQSSELSVGMTFEREGWIVDVESYLKNMWGLSTLSTSFQDNLDLEWDDGEARVRGLDLLIKRQWPSHRVWVAYTLSQVQYGELESLSPEPFPAPHDQRHNLKAVYLFQQTAWEMALGWNYHSGRPFTPALGTLPTFEADWDEDLLIVGPRKGEINSMRLPSYHRLDLSVAYNLPFQRWERGSGLIRLSLLNVLDRENLLSINHYNAYFDRSELEPDSNFETVEKLLLGFTPNLLFRLEW